MRAGERSYIVLSAHGGDEEYRLQMDVGIALAPRVAEPAKGAAETAVLQAAEAEQGPVTMRALVETEHREGFLEIREVSGERKLITCIEVLSPSNKRFQTPGWHQYVRKRQAFLEGCANFVELDLLRGGRRMPMEDEWPTSPYYLLTCRKQDAPKCTVWPAHFASPLPSIQVPLAPPDPDVALALQAMIQTIYSRSRYDRDIDYRKSLSPPLDAATCHWLDERMRQPQRDQF